MGCFQSWRVIGAVAGYRDNLVIALQGPDKAFFVHWPCAGDNFEIINPFVKFTVR